MNVDIRWKQRFENYEKAFLQLKRFHGVEELNEMEVQGYIKSFEYTYELAWKSIKDYLSFQVQTGITGSRDAFRQAFQKEMINDGEIWMQMIDDRILSVHTYDAETAETIRQNIQKEYFNCFRELYYFFKTKL
jgi:nucleotidyltransferase substrate binding protein (TIGR01987 family)